MTIKVKSLYNTLIIRALTKLNLNKWRKDFIVEVFSFFFSLKGRINFLQLARYGDYGEQRYRQQFEESFRKEMKILILTPSPLMKDYRGKWRLWKSKNQR